MTTPVETKESTTASYERTLRQLQIEKTQVQAELVKLRAQSAAITTQLNSLSAATNQNQIAERVRLQNQQEQIRSQITLLIGKETNIIIAQDYNNLQLQRARAAATGGSVPQSTDQAAAESAAAGSLPTANSTIIANDPITALAAAPSQAGLSAQQAAVTAQAREARLRRLVQPVRFNSSPDFRVRISLAPSANYLYRAPDPGILLPLRGTNGVLYPYMPRIDVGYSATYDAPEITHTNYKSYSYRSSSVENVSVTGVFTAQDSVEANYVLAVIHFFRSVTKMFYGQDNDPIRGTPPPMVFLSGLGNYNFDNHPMVITQFTLSYPDDVDYIQTDLGMSAPQDLSNQYSSADITGALRASINGVLTGVGAKKYVLPQSSDPTMNYARVPTKIQIAVQAMPVISRYAASNEFSLQKYASGQLLQGSKRGGRGGGFW
jgi:hypothetical protein